MKNYPGGAVCSGMGSTTCSGIGGTSWTGLSNYRKSTKLYQIPIENYRCSCATEGRVQQLVQISQALFDLLRLNCYAALNN